MTPVTDWTAGFLAGLAAGVTRFFSAIPGIIGALFILIIGWIIAASSERWRPSCVALSK